MELWSVRKQHTEQRSKTIIAPLEKMSKREMGNILTRFILEVRKKDGTLYPADSLHHIIARLQQHLRAIGCLVDFFSDKEFTEFRLSLDAEVKSIQSSGVGTKVHKAEIITVEEEKLL